MHGTTDKISPSPGTGDELADIPLGVSVKRAMAMLDLSQRAVYRLIETGELDSYHSGRARKVHVQSIHDYVARRLDAEPRRPAPQPADAP